MRLLVVIGRMLRILMLAFAGIGPAPPQQPPKGRDPTEQRSDGGAQQR